MAGHNKWSKIKHRKAVVDKRRGKVWTQCARAIMSAARQGGADPSANVTLRYAIDEARYANMPKDTIERAILKGVGEVGAENWEPVRYEGYGPGGVAVLVDALTNNRTRTVTDLRLIFEKHGGNLGNTGCVGYMFETRGRIVCTQGDRNAESMFELAIEAGADDVQAPEIDDDDAVDPPWTILTRPSEFQIVKEAIERAGISIAEAGLAMVPGTTIEPGIEASAALVRLIDALDDNDDVQKVYHNALISDEAITDA
jgi:YebC/PmpR family DNA-binding regulatory protein